MANTPAQTNSDIRYTISDVSNKLQVTPQLLRKWESLGYISPRRDSRGHRYYTQGDILSLKDTQKKLSTKTYAEQQARKVRLNKNTFFTISETSHILKTSPQLIRKWENLGYISPTRDENGHRYFTQLDIDKLKTLQNTLSTKEYALKQAEEARIDKNFKNNYLPATKQAFKLINKVQYGAMATGIMIAFVLFLSTLYTTDQRFNKTVKQNGKLLGTAIEQTIDDKSSQVAQVLGERNRVTDFWFYINVPTNIGNELVVQGDALFEGNITTPGVDLLGTGIL